MPPRSPEILHLSSWFLGYFVSGSPMKFGQIRSDGQTHTQCIRQDGSMSQRHLADVVGVWQNACWRRLQALHGSGVSTGTRARIDRAKLGLDLAVFVPIRMRIGRQIGSSSFGGMCWPSRMRLIFIGSVEITIIGSRSCPKTWLATIGSIGDGWMGPNWTASPLFSPWKRSQKGGRCIFDRYLGA